jgi:hypothetical protein
LDDSAENVDNPARPPVYGLAMGGVLQYRTLQGNLPSLAIARRLASSASP